jgi:hypothetical protein
MREMKIAEKTPKQDVVEVPAELWAIMETWPAIISRCRTASSNLIVSMKEMQDLEAALPLLLKMKEGK